MKNYKYYFLCKIYGRYVSRTLPQLASRISHLFAITNPFCTLYLYKYKNTSFVSVRTTIFKQKQTVIIGTETKKIVDYLV